MHTHFNYNCKLQQAEAELQTEVYSLLGSLLQHLEPKLAVHLISIVHKSAAVDNDAQLNEAVELCDKLASISAQVRVKIICIHVIIAFFIL
jgi:hypothetical protein